MTATTVDHAAQLSTGPAAHHRRRWVFAAIMVLVAVGVAIAVAARPVEPILVTDGKGRISLIDPRTGEATFTVTDAIKAPDGSSIYRARGFRRNDGS